MVYTIITANAETRKPLTVGPKLDVERNNEQKMWEKLNSLSEYESLVSDSIVRAGMPSFYTMQSLLRWAVENSTNDDGSLPPPRPQQPLDPAIIDHILGKPDSVLMKEALTIAVDETREEDDRVGALDDLEMVGISTSYSNSLTDR